MVNAVQHINVVRILYWNILSIIMKIIIHFLGCIHNGTHYEEDERIPDADFLCYTCYCHSSSIYCSAPDCEYRFDCEPEYLLGECCPRYDHCATQSKFKVF